MIRLETELIALERKLPDKHELEVMLNNAIAYVSLQRMFNNNYCTGADLSASIDKHIHIANAHVSAVVLGKEPTVIQSASEQYPIRVSFEFNGYTFYSVLSEGVMEEDLQYLTTYLKNRED